MKNTDNTDKEFEFNPGVDKNLYQEYDFEDVYWRKPGTQDYHPEFVYMASKVLKLPKGGYLVHDKTTGRYKECDKGSALLDLTNTHTGLVECENNHSFMINNDSYQQFIQRFVPVIEGQSFIPFGPKCIMYKGKKLVNGFSANIMRPDINEFGTKEFNEFMFLIRESLCDQPPATIEDTIAEISNPTGNKEFRFVMHWLAKIYQNPGVNLQTNLWFVGQTKGIGKGTLNRVLAVIFDSAHKQASMGDLGREWNDFIEGAIIMEADEFKANDKIDFNEWLKKETTNPTISINKRGNTPYSIPNITNWIFTTNDEEPIRVEEGDRRNVMIATTHNKEWTTRSIKVNEMLNKNLKGVAAGFCYLLSTIEVDETLVNRAFETKVRQNIQNTSMNAVEQWYYGGYISNEHSGTEKTATEWFNFYIDWAKEYFPKTSINNIQAWGKHLTVIANREGFAEGVAEGKPFTKRSVNGKINWKITNKDDNLFAKKINVEEENQPEKEGKNSKIMGMVKGDD